MCARSRPPRSVADARRTTANGGLTRRRLLQGGVAAGGALALGALTPTGRVRFATARVIAAPDAPKPGGTLTVGLTVFNVPTEDFDPVVMVPNAVSPSVHTHVFDRLVRVGHDGRTLHPALARSWKVSADGLTYTFALRGATFYDGSPVTADDAVWSLRRMQPVPPWSAIFPAFAVEAADERTVIARLERPWAPFLADLATNGASVLPRRLVEEQQKLFFQRPVGSGPFRFVSWDAEDGLVLAQHTGYWDPGKPYLDEVRFLVAPDADENLRRFRAGTVDVIPYATSAQVEELRTDATTAIVQNERFSTKALAINLSRPPFGDPKLRRALNYAVDRAALIAEFYGGAGTPATSYLPASLVGAGGSVPGFRFDLERAKTLVAESAAKDGFAGELIVPPANPVDLAVAKRLAAQFAQIGGTITVPEVAPDDLFARISANRYDLSLTGGFAQVGDPDSITRFMVTGPTLSTGDGQLTHYQNAAVDALAQEAAAMTDPRQRADAYRQLQTLVNDDPNWVFLVFERNVAAVRPMIRDFAVLPTTGLQLWDVWRDGA